MLFLTFSIFFALLRTHAWFSLCVQRTHERTNPKARVLRTPPPHSYVRLFPRILCTKKKGSAPTLYHYRHQTRRHESNRRHEIKLPRNLDPSRLDPRFECTAFHTPALYFFVFFVLAVWLDLEVCTYVMFTYSVPILSCGSVRSTVYVYTAWESWASS